MQLNVDWKTNLQKLISAPEIKKDICLFLNILRESLFFFLDASDSVDSISFSRYISFPAEPCDKAYFILKMFSNFEPINISALLIKTYLYTLKDW